MPTETSDTRLVLLPKGQTAQTYAWRVQIPNRRAFVHKTMNGMAFGTRDLKYWVLGPPETEFTQHLKYDSQCGNPIPAPPQLPFKTPQVPSNRDCKALNRGTLGGLGTFPYCGTVNPTGVGLHHVFKVRLRLTGKVVH